MPVCLPPSLLSGRDKGCWLGSSGILFKLSSYVTCLIWRILEMHCAERLNLHVIYLRQCTFDTLKCKKVGNRNEIFIYSSSVSTFFPVRVKNSISGTLGMRQKYTLNRTLVHIFHTFNLVPLIYLTRVNVERHIHGKDMQALKLWGGKVTHCATHIKNIYILAYSFHQWTNVETLFYNN